MSALLGDQYTGQPDEARLTRAFNWFYFSCNTYFYWVLCGLLLLNILLYWLAMGRIREKMYL